MFKIPDNVSQYDNVYDVLKERGFIEQTTDDEGIRELLGREKIKFYIGFDATADCLHVGHFMQVIIMMYMQKYGHTPVVLIKKKKRLKCRMKIYLFGGENFR